MACSRIFFGKGSSLFALRSRANTDIIRTLKGNDYNRLPVIENYDYLRNIHVPHGIFLNSKILSARLDRFSQFSDESEIYEDYAQYNKQSAYDYPGSPSSPISLTASPTPSYMAVSPPRQHRSLPTSFSREGNQPILLPPITTLGSGARRPSLHRPHHGDMSRQVSYAPLSPEDRRVLDSFRVVL